MKIAFKSERLIKGRLKLRNSPSSLL